MREIAIYCSIVNFHLTFNCNLALFCTNTNMKKLISQWSFIQQLEQILPHLLFAQCPYTLGRINVLKMAKLLNVGQNAQLWW
jgi:hypothetical protein